MPKIKLEAQLSQEDLFQAVKQLTMTELEEFTQNVIAFRAKQITPNLSKKEANLLLKINQDVDDKIKQSYEILIKKKEAENLTENGEGNSLIDKFLKTNQGSIRRVTEGSNVAENENRLHVAEKSVTENDELITETLAAIYFQQKNYEKAKESYHKLSLKYPEKSIYFAARIEEIEILTNSNS